MNKYLKKQLKDRDHRLKYDFLPSMIQIIEKPVNRIGLIIMYVMIAFIVTSIVWACYSKIDIAVTADGFVDTENALVTLNSLTDGTIHVVNVRDGEYVDKGDVICTLVSDVSEATIKEYEYNLEVLNIQKEVYEEIYSKYKNDDYTALDIDLVTFGKNSRFAEAIVLENDIFVKKMKTLSYDEREKIKSSQLLSVIQNLNTIDAQIQSMTAELKAAQKNLSDKQIVATESGVYSFPNKLYVGKAVNVGDVMGYITSVESKYKFTAYVTDEDVAQLKKGDMVKLKIAAFKDTAYEYIDGEIIHVGDVSMNIEGKGVSYIVDIRIDAIPDNIRSGMEGGIDIIVGKRTVMDYFLEPFKKGLDDSLKEK